MLHCFLVFYGIERNWGVSDTPTDNPQLALNMPPGIARQHAHHPARHAVRVERRDQKHKHHHPLPVPHPQHNTTNPASQPHPPLTGA
jgi:hypothetical protein